MNTQENNKIQVVSFFDKSTSTMTYIVYDPQTKDAAIIDPVMQYDPAGSLYSFEPLEDVVAFIKENELSTHYIIETHAHADHLSGSQELKRVFPQAQLVIGEKIIDVQKGFKEIFNLDDHFSADGHQFDRLVREGERLSAGSLSFEVMHTPGHTAACYSYKIEDMVFVGDALFMPDFGVARCDFPGGSAETLFDSIVSKLYQLPPETKIYTAHDYQPGGRELKYSSTIGESKKHNIHINETTKKEQFVQMRNERDKTLSAPRLLYPSLQLNINAGHWPQKESNQVSYFKLPIRRKDGNVE